MLGNPFFIICDNMMQDDDNLCNQNQIADQGLYRVFYNIERINAFNQSVLVC